MIRNRKFKTYLQFLALAMTLSLGSLGSLGPPLLTATTRNSYSSFSVKFGTVALSCEPGTSIPVSNGSEGPSELTALTRNLYSGLSIVKLAVLVNGLPSNSHWMSGGGSPVMLTLNLIG
uniref:Uncharacterized protein n=1 Tax=Romanomermis culicivorax TaxID=13658 RepID=A0A915KH31_ROMCU